MASQKQIDKWVREAGKISDNPEYINAYIEYKQKAKKADQRLVRLEALAHEEHFRGVLEFGYKRAIRDIASWGGNKRFNTAPPTTLTQLEAKIADIENFIAASTSTKTTILEIYQKRADTFNKGYVNKQGQLVGGWGNEYGVEFTWEDIANYYEDKKNVRKDIQLGSKTEVRALAVIKKLGKDVAGDILETRKKIQRITGDDKILAKEVENLVKQGYTYDNLMGGN